MLQTRSTVIEKSARHFSACAMAVQETVQSSKNTVRMILRFETRVVFYSMFLYFSKN
jgi:hypothetical protein